MKHYKILEQLLQRWYIHCNSPEVSEEIMIVLNGAPMSEEPVTPVTRDTVFKAKQDAMRMLKRMKNNEPLDPELLKLVIRGYIGMLDLVLAMTR